MIYVRLQNFDDHSLYVSKLFLSATVSVVSVESASYTAVRVTWTPLNLPVVDHYTVHYSIVNGGRQSNSGTVNYPASVFSGVVSGLFGGQQYQFSVSVTLSVGQALYMSVPGPSVTGMCLAYALVASSDVISKLPYSSGFVNTST